MIKPSKKWFLSNYDTLQITTAILVFDNFLAISRFSQSYWFHGYYCAFASASYTRRNSNISSL